MSEPIGSVFERLGGTVIDPAMVVPSALPLDLCGESVRARLCVFTDHANRDMALRPDLTLPVALHEIEARKQGAAAGEQVYRYNARAFRQPLIEDEPLEFLQVGFERFGSPRTPIIDAEAYVLVSEAAMAAGARNGVARFGDLGILPAFIDALDISPTMNAGLRRAFREQGGVQAILERANRPQESFAAQLVGLDREVVKTKVAEHMAARNLHHFADRTADEVIDRLMEQARDLGSAALPEQAVETLDAVLALVCPPSEAGGLLLAIARRAGIEPRVREMIEMVEQRWAFIAERAPHFLEGAEFSPAFGRRFTYYDGFVFEIGEAGDRALRPFGAGGRYDSLLSDLSRGEVCATAIGGVVRPDRLEQAKTGNDMS